MIKVRDTGFRQSRVYRVDLFGWQAPSRNGLKTVTAQCFIIASNPKTAKWRAIGFFMARMPKITWNATKIQPVPSFVRAGHKIKAAA